MVQRAVPRVEVNESRRHGRNPRVGPDGNYLMEVLTQVISAVSTSSETRDRDSATSGKRGLQEMLERSRDGRGNSIETPERELDPGTSNAGGLRGDGRETRALRILRGRVRG